MYITVDALRCISILDKKEILLIERRIHDNKTKRVPKRCIPPISTHTCPIETFQRDVRKITLSFNKLKDLKMPLNSPTLHSFQIPYKTNKKADFHRIFGILLNLKPSKAS